MNEISFKARPVAYIDLPTPPPYPLPEPTLTPTLLQIDCFNCLCSRSIVVVELQVL